MKLTKEQSQEIKEQTSQKNITKRVTSPELEKILYEAIPALDHGFVRVVDYMGDDTSIVQSASSSDMEIIFSSPEPSIKTGFLSTKNFSFPPRGDAFSALFLNCSNTC